MRDFTPGPVDLSLSMHTVTKGRLINITITCIIRIVMMKSSFKVVLMVAHLAIA